MTLPTKEEAWQFALMLGSGMPSSEAIAYFFPDEPDANILRSIHDRWVKSEAVSDATLRLQGKAWQQMSAEEKIRLALDNHYAQLAYFLYSRNYVELEGTGRQKADTARQALEAKLSGMAGKMDALTRFYDDILQNRVKLVPRPDSRPIAS